MAQWVLDALAEAQGIGRVLLVGPPELAELDYRGELERVPAKGTLVENLYAGIDRLLELDPAMERAAYCWSDIPLVTGPMLDLFLAGAVNWVDVEAGLVERRYAIRSRIQRVADPELGLDVDGPVNLEICRRVLADRT